MRTAALLAAALFSFAALAQNPNICGIEAPPTVCKGDPIGINGGYTFHIVTDVELNSGAGSFQLQRYFRPVGALGGSKSPLMPIIHRDWPTGAPPAPFGVWSRDGGVAQLEPRPTWSHDLYSYVAPANQSLLDGGTGIALSLVFEGDFKWTAFKRSGTTGLQQPYGNNPGTPLRLDGLPDGYRLIKEDREQWIYQKLLGSGPTTAPVLLSEVRRPDGQLRFSVEYPPSGCVNLASALIFPNGGRLEFGYSAACTLTGLSWRPPGGSTTSSLASYAYVENRPGRVLEGGPVSTPESYTYPITLTDLGGGFTIEGWSFNVLRGSGTGAVPRASHEYLLNGPAATGYNGHSQDPNFSLQGSFDYIYAAPEYIKCDVQTDTIDDQDNFVTSSAMTYELSRMTQTDSESGGSPSASSGTVDSTYSIYNDDIFGAGVAQVGKQVDTCGGASCASGSVVNAVAPLVWNSANICSDGRDGGSPAVPYAFKDKRDSWSMEKLSLTSSGEHMLISVATGMASYPPPLADGGSGYLAAGALENATLNRLPQEANSVRINTRVELPSSISPSNSTIFDQRFIDTGTSNGFPTRFMEIAWQSGYTQDIAGNTISQFRATFYKRSRSCSGSTAIDPANRVLRIEGPCLPDIDTPYATTCSWKSAEAFPVTEFHYYDNSASNNDRGRLEKVVRYPNSSRTNCGAGLTTTYANYTPEGLPQLVTDPNTVTTTFTFNGSQMLSRTVGSASTSFTYELDGTLRSIQDPEGDFEIFCRHANSTASCDFSAALIPNIQWKAKSASANGASASERVDFEYWADGQLKTETHRDGSGTVRLVKRHFPDVSGRPTWDGTGATTSGVAVKRRFDSNNNLVAVGSTLTGAPDFCNLSTPSPLCTWMTYDRADRLAQLEVNASGISGAQTKTCLDYDAQGNLRRVLPGCSASATCSINSSSGPASACGSDETDYVVDDFGEVVAVLSSPGIVTRYERNALGLPTKRTTSAQTAVGVWNEWTYDQLGRMLTATKQGAGGAEQLYAFVYDAPIPGTNCPTASAARVLGRLGYREDTFGLTGYSYDAAGKVTKEWRQRIGAYGSCGTNPLVNPSTEYSYTPNGNLASIVYPHGRTVTYNYGAGGRRNRIDSMSLTSWTGSSWQSESLLTNIDWEPYGDLRRYAFVTGANVSNVVTYSKEGPAQSPVANACTAAIPTSSPDTTGRTTGVFLSQGGSSGNVLKKFLSWTGDALTTEQTCFTALAQTAEHRQSYGLDKMGRITSVAGTNMPAMTHGPGNTPWTAGHARAYAYTPRGERDDSSIDGCSRDLTEGRASMLSSALPTSSCASPVLEGPTLLYDASGRTREVRSGASGSSQFREQLGYGAGGGLESVFSNVALKRFGTALYWEYYYDAFNRRRAKVPPTGTSQMEEFFYDLGHQELESLGGTGSYLTQIDENIWLAGRLVAVFRDNLMAETHQRADPVGECARPGVAASCGLHFVINDALPKPILVLRQTSNEITGAALYDEFGHVNRIPFIVGATDSKSLGRVSLPGGTVDARAFWRRAAGDGALFEGNAQGANLAAQWGPWTSTDGATASATSAADITVQAEAVEYRRYSEKAHPWFPNLRFPGQHWDEETDLFENWNRFYDPGSGRYLSPEPLLQNPRDVRRMAQAGMSVPTYAYAANNPLRYTDPNGLEVMNLGGSPLVIKVEIGNSYELLMPGDTYHGKQDAVYTESGEVYKTAGKADTPGGNVIVNPDGTVEVSSNPGGGFGETAWNELGPFSVGDHFLKKNDWLSREAAKRLIQNAKKGVCGGR